MYKLNIDKIKTFDHKLYEYCTQVLSCCETGTVIAGGAIRSMIEGDFESSQDIDVFFKKYDYSHSDFKKIDNDDYCASLISVTQKENPLEFFDFTIISGYMTKNGDIFVHDNMIEDIKNKKLRFVENNKLLTNLGVYRLSKYLDIGYTPHYKDFLNILNMCDKSISLNEIQHGRKKYIGEYEYENFVDFDNIKNKESYSIVDTLEELENIKVQSLLSDSVSIRHVLSENNDYVVYNKKIYEINHFFKNIIFTLYVHYYNFIDARSLFNDFMESNSSDMLKQINKIFEHIV